MLCRETSTFFFVCVRESYNTHTHKRIMCKEAAFILLALAVHTQTTRLEMNDSYKAQSTEIKLVCGRKLRFSSSAVQGCIVGRGFEEFGRNVLPQSSRPTTILRNASNSPPSDTASYPRIPEFPHKPGKNLTSRVVDMNFIHFVV